MKKNPATSKKRQSKFGDVQQQKPVNQREFELVQKKIAEKPLIRQRYYLTLPSRRLYVGNLPVSVGLDKLSLLEFFNTVLMNLGMKTVNPIIEIHMQGASRFCFLEFRCARDNLEAYTMLQGITLGECPLKVNKTMDYQAPPEELMEFVVPDNINEPVNLNTVVAEAKAELKALQQREEEEEQQQQQQRLILEALKNKNETKKEEEQTNGLAENQKGGGGQQQQQNGNSSKEKMKNGEPQSEKAASEKKKDNDAGVAAGVHSAPSTDDANSSNGGQIVGIAKNPDVAAEMMMAASVPSTTTVITAQGGGGGGSRGEETTISSQRSPSPAAAAAIASGSSCKTDDCKNCSSSIDGATVGGNKALKGDKEEEDEEEEKMKNGNSEVAELSSTTGVNKVNRKDGDVSQRASALPGAAAIRTIEEEADDALNAAGENLD
eukprot:jgi/Bigna1/138221/aug1.43_g12929